MKVAVLLVGLPGSGKTHYIQQHAFDVVYDDCCNIPNVFEQAASLPPDVAIVMADPRLCLQSTLRIAQSRLTEAGFEIAILYWSNEPEAAKRNVRRRNDGREIHHKFVDRLSVAYKPPRTDFLVYRDPEETDEATNPV